MSSISKIDSSKISIFAFGFFSGEEQAIINIDKIYISDGEILNKNGVIVDWREPNVIRFAPVPLYNSFH